MVDKDSNRRQSRLPFSFLCPGRCLPTPRSDRLDSVVIHAHACELYLTPPTLGWERGRSLDEDGLDGEIGMCSLAPVAASRDPDIRVCSGRQYAANTCVCGEQRHTSPHVCARICLVCEPRCFVTVIAHQSMLIPRTSTRRATGLKDLANSLL